MERVLQARIIFWAVGGLRGGGVLSVCGNAGLRSLKGSPGLHFAIFEDGGSEFLLDVADAVGIISRYMGGTTTAG